MPEIPVLAVVPGAGEAGAEGGDGELAGLTGAGAAGAELPLQLVELGKLQQLQLVSKIRPELHDWYTPCWGPVHCQNLAQPTDVSGTNWLAAVQDAALGGGPALPAH